MTVSAALAALYARIPSVDCIPGCTDCCGPIPLSKDEAPLFGPFPLAQVDAEFAIATTPDCPNSRGHNCRIYNDRPFICRIFGTVEASDALGSSERRLICPHGRKPKKPLTQKQAAEMTREYFEIASKR
jgi:uncharacterized protein